MDQLSENNTTQKTHPQQFPTSQLAVKMTPTPMEAMGKMCYINLEPQWS